MTRGPNGAVPARSLASWSNLWRYSTTQLVIYGSLAAMLIPLVAEASAFIDALLQSRDMGSFQKLVSQVGWRLFAVDLYISGLFLVAGKFLTQICCPERIRRFPYEDDHFIFIASVDAAHAELEKPSVVASQSPGDAVAGRLAKWARDTEVNATRTNQAWRESDLALPWLRWLVAGLYVIGSGGLAAFFAVRAWDNLRAVLHLGGF